jgi:tetratricopeptide (TPR) repeat protein
VTKPLFEQYKEALRKGHLAARAGTIDVALEAYAEAARLAPERAAPHASRATALHRAGRGEEAQAAFVRALAIAPDDEATLRARAAVFEEIGRSASAAADLEHLAEALEAAGRRAEALATARHSVALTATPARRRLVERLEAPEGDRPIPPRPERTASQPQPIPPEAEGANPPARAPRKTERRPRHAIRPEAAPEAARAAATTAARKPRGVTRSATAVDLPTATPTGAAAEPPDEDAAEPPRADPTQAGPAIDQSTERPATAPKAGKPIAEAPQATAPQAEPPIETTDELSIPWPAVDLPSPPPPMPVGPPPNVDTLMADATALIDAGDLLAARNLMLTAVAVHRAAGRPDAALDVCLQLLALAPGDAYVHLAIAGLQLDRGWRPLATEKIALLLRLTALTGDTQAEADVHALAAERVRDEPPATVGKA